MPSGDFSLTIGYWIVSHKATLKRWWAISLLAIIFFATFWVVASMSVFFAQENRVISRIQGSATQLSAYAPAKLGVPSGLAIGDVTLIRRDAQRADLVAFVKNKNTQWGATRVSYHFVAGSTTTPTVTVSINPGEERPVMSLNQTVGDAASAILTVDHVEWTHGIPAANSGQFKVADVAWEPTQVKIAGVSVTTVNLRAKITNTSIYNYYHVDVAVILRSSDRIVAVDELSYDKWPTNGDKSLTASWPYAVSGVTDAVVLPTINKYDTANRY